MRSRYSAFVLGKEQYLLKTWHASTRPDSLDLNRSQRWLGLQIVDTQVTGPNCAEVEFIARYRIGGASASRLHERSRFVREHDRWLYLDGTLKETPTRSK